MNVNGNQHISINIDKQSDKKPRGVEKLDYSPIEARDQSPNQFITNTNYSQMQYNNHNNKEEE